MRKEEGKINQIIKKKDFLFAAVIGFLFGIFALPILKNIKLPFLHVGIVKGAIIIVSSVLFSIFALWVASLIGKKLPIILQIAKFSATGSLNTFIDFGILNILIIISNIKAGFILSLFSGISFMAATINSYFWNKYWTFGSTKKAEIKELGDFLVVSIIGLLINMAVFSITVNFISPISNFTPERWANGSKLIATIFSLIWNFVGYKFVVFKKGRSAPAQAQTEGRTPRRDNR